jgi:uncharacterized protein (DUF2126 family)
MDGPKMTLGAVQNWFRRERRERNKKEAAERAKSSLTELRQGRLLEMFKENDSLLHHGGSPNIVKILNGLGDGMADWWQRMRWSTAAQSAEKRESAEGSMTARQEARLEKLFAANEIAETSRRLAWHCQDPQQTWRPEGGTQV